MASTQAMKHTSLVPQFDEIMASSEILCAAGTENLFAEFVGHQLTVHSKAIHMTGEIAKLKSENEANEIKLKHARSSFDYQMQKRVEAEEALKQYEKQFSIILELLGDNKFNTLTAEERRSLAMLKDNKAHSPYVARRSSQELSAINESSVVLSPSDISVDPGDLDENVSFLRDGKKWKRRRTASIDSPPNKKKRSNDGTATVMITSEEDEAVTKPTLSPTDDLNKIPPLERQFKKPPPMKKRRPSKQHLKQSSVAVTDLDDAMEAISSSPPPTSEDTTDSDDPLPTAPPPLYPLLPSEATASPTRPQVHVDDEPTPTNTPDASPMIYRSQSDFNMLRQHTFFNKTALKLESVNCQACHTKVRIAHSYLKCQDCRMSCHPKCRSKAQLPCVPCVPTPKKKLQNLDLAIFCPRTIPRVPALIVHCVNEIEKRGLNSVGLYRISGFDRTVKELRDRLLRSKGHPSLDKVTDINVLCGVVKDFLRSLREPILTFALHETFIKAASADTDEDVLASTLEAIAKLPPSNKDTLAFLILHLQRVASYSAANKMPIPNLVTVFAPTIVGHGSVKPSNNDLLRDTKHQTKVMDKLLGISSDYWRQYLSPMENPNPNVSPTPSVQSIQSSPALLSPATPELRPVPESPFLGSCHTKAPQTPRLPRLGATPVVLSHPKRTGHFLPALN